LRVIGAIHHAHGATTNLGFDKIAAQALVKSAHT